MDINQISGAVLAGGFSSRMGQNKAELLLNGERLIERQVKKLKSLGIEDLILSGYNGKLEGARTIPDVYPHRGPLSGVHACLLQANKKACLFVSVDVPLVPEQTLLTLCRAHENGATVLCHGEKTEPLIAVYDCCLASEAEKLLLTGKPAMMRFLEAIPHKEVLFEGDERLLANCNTPEEFVSVEEILSFKSINN